MTFYENPMIGWFLKKKIKKIIVVFILSLFIYLLFFRHFNHSISYGCLTPNCYATPCTGYDCRASACQANNCKGGDCIGENCEAGDCKGVGCRAGDCYGIYCTPGDCIDPECQGERKLKNQCTPFCSKGKSYSIPRSILYPYTKKLPKNSFLNPDYCNYNKRSNIFTSDRYINNFKVDYINLYTSGNVKYEDYKYPENLQTGKTYILTNDLNFIDTTPNVYKNDKCEWATKFKEIQINSDFMPFYNIKKQDTTWKFKSYLAEPFDDSGEVSSCEPSKTHEMKVYMIYSVINQINQINSKQISQFNKNFEIDEIYGEKINTKCNFCNKNGYQYLDITSHPTNMDNSIIPCLIRSYNLEPIKKSWGEVYGHKVSGFQKFAKFSEEYNKFILDNVNKLNTFRDHHLWTYTTTIGNEQIYSCYWCRQQVRVKYLSLPRYRNRNNDLVLSNCSTTNDNNHYMYDLIDNNNTVYQKCLKCEKKSYPYEQNNI